MKEVDPNKVLGFLVNDVARLMTQWYNKRTRKFGLTQRQWQVLVYINVNPGINQSALSRLLEIQPITLSRILDIMEESGLIVRKPDPNDRRAVRLHLAPGGEPALEDVMKLGARERSRSVEGLPDGHLEITIETLAHIKRYLISGLHNEA
jgi:MarR family transcriptional regulator for hemolysin